jgi:hypothetical protein
MNMPVYPGAFWWAGSTHQVSWNVGRAGVVTIAQTGLLKKEARQ